MRTFHSPSREVLDERKSPEKKYKKINSKNPRNISSSLLNSTKDGHKELK